MNGPWSYHGLDVGLDGEVTLAEVGQDCEAGRGQLCLCLCLLPATHSYLMYTSIKLYNNVYSLHNFKYIYFFFKCILDKLCLVICLTYFFK